MNDPTEYPKPNRLHGSYHWKFERAIAVCIIPLIATATVKHGASGILDGALSLVLVLHSHKGYNAILGDYLPVRKFHTAGPIGKWLVRLASVLAFAGLYGTLSLEPNSMLTSQNSTRVRTDMRCATAGY